MAWVSFSTQVTVSEPIGSLGNSGSKCDPVAMLVEIIINKQNRCIPSVRITPT